MAQSLDALAHSLPAYRAAIALGDHQPRSRVSEEMLIRQIITACDLCAREGMTTANEAALDLTAEAEACWMRSKRWVSGLKTRW